VSCVFLQSSSETQPLVEERGFGRIGPKADDPEDAPGFFQEMPNERGTDAPLALSASDIQVPQSAHGALGSVWITI